jgi:HD-like signal output (HDOD) protein
MTALDSDVPVRSTAQRVLFVDDEPHLLAALRRMLRPERERWEMVFADSGAEALRLMAEQPVDAIVSDMRMPGMSGAELLSLVQHDFPSTARIILSGQADLTSILAVVRSAQQFLAKPCDAQTLASTIDRALSVQRSLADRELRELIGGVTSLPSLPHVYHELVDAIESADADLPCVARILASDIATSTDLLKLVNSAFFGLPREVGSVESAVSLLGLENIQALVLAGSVFRMNDKLTRSLDAEELRDRSLHRAAIGRVIAEHEGWPRHERDIAVLSCLLREVGELVLAEGLPVAARRLATRLREEDGPVDPDRRSRLETECYGCTVSQASAYLLAQWGFSPAVVHTVATHPVAGSDPGISRFEWVLDFASRQALDPGSPVILRHDSYLTGERAQRWTAATAGVAGPRSEG